MASLGLPAFETVAECLKRNTQMIRRLERHGAGASTLQNIKDSVSTLSTASADQTSNLGFDGDWIASRRYRLGLISQAHELLSRHQGPLAFVTVAHPKWKKSAGRLADSNIQAATQWMYRALSLVEDRTIAIGGYEASINVELDGSVSWSGHFHLVIAGADKKQLKAALNIPTRYQRQKYSRPVTIEQIGNLAKRLGYSTKRIGKRGVAYIGKNGRQQRRKLPLSTVEQIEFDSWLSGIPVGGRTFLFGCRLHHNKLRLTHADD
ncbi:MAG: hypothetical protein NTZ72_04395 [Afipia sp.]|nr:hypothetical protein [Afipia sp.]